MTLDELKNQSTYLCSTDLISAIEHWKTEIEYLEEDLKDFNENFKPECDTVDFNNLDETKEYLKQYKEYLKELENFIEPFENYSDWDCCALLIPEGEDFVEYIEETVKDCCNLSDVPDWVVIDWEATAENLKHDYIHNNGYLMRA